MKLFLAATALSASFLSAAHPGKAPYELYCAACHAPDGKGTNNGQFPALANSEWVKGDANRAIQVVLHGLQGKIKVAGKDYNLVMPPQGAALQDEQIAGIISYVRSAWGNKESEITKADVAAARKASANQKGMWQANELLKKYPLPKKIGPLNDLLSYTHHGKFKRLAQLRASKPVNAEEEKGGFISLNQAALKNDKRDFYGMTWTGWLDAPFNGRYNFYLDTDDGGALSVNGKELIRRDRVGPAGKPTKKSLNLKKGRNEIKIEYFEYTGHEAISLAWEGPGLRKQYLSEQKQKKKSSPTIPYLPPAGEAIIYRNFIAGTDPRGIGVGYSEGVNLAFSADSMSLDLLWKGKFMDAGRHWTGRGQGFEAPGGERIMGINRGIPFAILESQTTAWPKKVDDKLKPLFKGYELDKQQQPTFHYRFGPLKMTDTPLPSSEGFHRTIVIEVPSPGMPEKQLYFRALSGGPIATTGERIFTFDQELLVNVTASGSPPFLRENEVLIPVPLAPGKHEIKISYTWK